MTQVVSANRRYLAIVFPFLPTDRWRQEEIRACEPPSEAPLAFVEKLRGTLRLAAIDREAHTLGLVPGMALADARAQVPDLSVCDHDPHRDLLWLERIGDACDRYTPMVMLDPPDGLTLDITGCAHLFGGETGLVADLERRMRRWVAHLRHAFADTPEAAQALARFQATPAADETSAIRRLPIAALRLDEDVEMGLRRAGMKTIGDLASRPAAPLAARFGTTAVTALDRLLGRRDSRLSPRRPVPLLIVERRLAEPIARTEDALKIIEDLLDEACQRLAECQKGGRRFDVRLYRSDGDIRDLVVETGRPVRDPAIVLRLLRERIETLADPIDPGFGFDLVRLAVPLLEALEAGQLALEGGAVAEGELAALIDRLSVRAGRGRFRRLISRDTHIPEQATLALPAVETAPASWPVPETGEPPARPLHLFEPPQPIEVMAEMPDGPPHRFRWQRQLHEVVRYEGPERIAAEWWTRPESRPGLTRDYYRVEDARGRRFWVFRHGLYGVEKPHPGWYVHGLFA